MILAALAEYPPPLADEAATLARSEHPGLALEAIRALARVGGPPGDAALASALAALSDRAFDSTQSEERRATALRLLGDALPVAFPRAREPKTYRVAQAIYARLNAVSQPTRADALAHCAAAELVDRGRGWPAKTPGCGLHAAPAHLGPRRTAALLADVPGRTR
jgi:hypothetical protein